MNIPSAKKNILKSMVLGLLASISIYISVDLEIPAWVLFIGWASHDLFCPKFKNVFSVLLQEIIGMLLAFTINIIGYFLQTYIEIWGILFSVFLIVALLYWVAKAKYFNNIIAYFLGMTAWFSFQSDDIQNALPILTLSLSIGFCFGYSFSWLSNKIETKY